MSAVGTNRWLWNVPGYFRTIGAAKALVAPRIIGRYLQEQRVRILNLAAGPLFEHDAYRNWLSADIINAVRCKSGVYSVYMDLTKRFPIPSGSFDAILSQQCIEHFTYEAGRHILTESRRILKPGGTMRVETPDVRYFVRRYLDGHEPPRPPAAASAEKEMRAPVTNLTALNQIFMLWGHRYVYDPETLADLCRSCGFSSVRHVPMGVTEIARLQPALALNPDPAGDPYFIECSFALELTA